jgi:anti-anti-sigma factor
MAVHPATRADPSPAKPLRALTYRVGDVAVIALAGRLEGTGARELDLTLTEAQDQGHCTVVVDLHQLDGVDPNSLGVLWAGLRATMRRGGTLAAAGLQPALRPTIDPLVPHGLSVHRTIRSAIAARDEGGEQS